MSAELKAKYDQYCSKPGQLTSKDLKKMFEDAKLYKKPKFSTNDTDIAHSKFGKAAKSVDFNGFCSVLDQLDKEGKAKRPDMEAAIIKSEKVVSGVGTSKTGGVDRLTDTSKYTGAHKERFDADGKGKGAAGRTDKADSSGYVGAYKGEGTYGKK